VEVNNKATEWNGMDCIRLVQDENLYVITKPQVLKGKEDFLSR
jgi:hypothetical protein